MMETAVLVPVLDRPHRVRPLLDSIDAATPEFHRVLFIAQSDDLKELAALKEAGADFIVVDPSRRSYAKKINDGCRASSEPLLFLAADDLHCHPGWLTQAQALLTEGVQVVGTNDGGNPRTIDGTHSTHTLVTRSYIDDIGGVIDRPPGIVLNEMYPHSWVDDEFIQTAMARGVYAHAFDSHVEHLHYLWGKGEMDDTYRLGAQGDRRGRQLFARRRKLWRAGSTLVGERGPELMQLPAGARIVPQ